jgi:hypothetical protein
VQLLDVEPEIARGLSAEDEAHVRRVLVVHGVQLAPGAWRPPPGLPRAIGAVVLDGILLQDTTTFARRDVQLFGREDVIDGHSLADGASGWRVLHRSHLALLDDRFVLAARRWPALLQWLARRLFQAQRDQHTIAAITAMPRVEERLLALMCHLADRWGRVTPDGVTLALPVTHATLGDLVGARRPTISLALTTLNDRRLLRRLPDGTWLLPPDCGDWAASGVPGAPPKRAD